MVSSNLLQVVTKSPIDKVMYGNPQVTFFKSVYKRASNFASNYIFRNINSNIDWGSTLRIKIPRDGDLLGGITIRIKLSDLKRKYFYFFQGNSVNADSGVGPGFNIGTHNLNSTAISSLKNYSAFEAGLPTANGSYTTDPQFTSFVNGIGSIIVREVSLIVGGKTIETLPGEWMFINNELHSNNNSKEMFYDSVYFNKTEFNPGETNVSNIDMVISVPFYFTRDSGLYLPIVAMFNENIELEIKLRTLEECLIRKYQNNEDPNTAPGNNGYYWFKSDDPVANQTPNVVLGMNGPRPYFSVDTGTKYNEDVVATIDTLDVIYKYYYLDDDEKDYFLTNTHNYIVPITQHMKSDYFTYQMDSEKYIDMEFRNAIRYFVFTIQRRDNLDDGDYFNFSYESKLKLQNSSILELYDNKKYILDMFNLEINNYDLLDKIPSKILNNIEFYNKFKNSSNILLYVYSFALYPNEVAPSGSFNFSKLHNQFIKLKLIDPSIFNNEELMVNIYVSSYNILSISEGLTGFRYY